MGYKPPTDDWRQITLMHFRHTPHQGLGIVAISLVTFGVAGDTAHRVAGTSLQVITGREFSPAEWFFHFVE
jgi:hypothetical protein